jgi:hypothetical protein
MAIPRNPKRSGGPRSSIGKKAVSANALQHGLTVQKPVTDAEVLLEQKLLQELVAHYAPRNPLEKLQVERIARTAAKLQKLEQVNAALVRETRYRASQPTLSVLEELDPIASEVVREGALRRLWGLETPPVFGFTDRVLAKLSLEICERVHLVHTVADLESLMPVVCAHLRKHAVAVASADLGFQLLAMVTTFKPLEIRPWKDTEFERLIAQVGAEKRRQEVLDAGCRPERTAEALSTGLQDDLNLIQEESAHRKAVVELVSKFNKTKPLRLQAAMPEGEVNDRLMRYHTTLDRQLSRCIGEFLQMRSMH